MSGTDENNGSIIRPNESHLPTAQTSGLSSQFENNYFTEMCSGSEAGSYLKLIDFVYHSTLGLRVIKKKRVDRFVPVSAAVGVGKVSDDQRQPARGPAIQLVPGLVFKAHRRLYHST